MRRVFSKTTLKIKRNSGIINEMPVFPRSGEHEKTGGPEGPPVGVRSEWVGNALVGATGVGVILSFYIDPLTDVDEEGNLNDEAGFHDGGFVNIVR